ncbi:hypothetical protein [Comamonas jiangduensis]|uniref:hypothetical protein n=1 Tax=Comamonas jiangduensis TaxID=1194168 RepID=UPI003BF8A472
MLWVGVPLLEDRLFTKLRKLSRCTFPDPTDASMGRIELKFILSLFTLFALDELPLLCITCHAMRILFSPMISLLLKTPLSAFFRTFIRLEVGFHGGAISLVELFPSVHRKELVPSHSASMRKFILPESSIEIITLGATNADLDVGSGGS